MTKKTTGKQGEIDVVNLIPCPNCRKKLMLLPENYPLYDVQCTACQFRAQVKTSRTRPKDFIRGAGWDIMDKVLKTGFLVPPLITNFKWLEKGQRKQEMRFYPFIDKKHLIKRVADIKSEGRKYNMFNYNLKGLQYYTLYQK